MNFYVKLLMGIIFLISFFYFAFSQQTDKCTNSTNSYLCDPGFENSSVRNGNIVYPKQRSSVRTNLKEVNHCLGGPYTGFEFDPPWNFTLWWYTHGPDYNFDPNPPPPPTEPLNWGRPDFLSWYQPTNASPDYFHRNAAYTSYDNLVAVPNNFIGYQEPAEGVNDSGYVGLWIETSRSPHNEEHYDGLYQEYVQSRLKQPLIKNHKYMVSFKVSLAGNSFSYGEIQNKHYHYIKKLYAYFSSGPLLE